MVLTGQPLTSVSHASSWEDFASNRSISDALWHLTFSQTSALDEDEGHPGCALPPHDEHGVLVAPLEHGGEPEPPLLHLLLQHEPLLLQLVHDLIDAMCR